MTDHGGISLAQLMSPELEVIPLPLAHLSFRCLPDRYHIFLHTNPHVARKDRRFLHFLLRNSQETLLTCRWNSLTSAALGAELWRWIVNNQIGHLHGVGPLAKAKG